jgi:hypothetical protein
MPYPSHPDYPWLEDDYVFGPFYRPMMYWYDRTDKKLYIGPDNEPHYAITSWDQGFDFFAYDEHMAQLRPLEVCDPPLDIPLLRYDNYQNFREFLDEIPQTVRESMLPIRFRRALGLRIIRKRPEAKDLARSIPALFLLLVNMVQCGKLTMDEAAGLTLKRRREIACACGCEPSESTVKVLSKIHAVCWEEDSARIGVVAAAPLVMRELAFFPRITVALINTLAEWPGLARCAFFRRDSVFLDTVCGAEAREFLDDLLALRADILRMAGYLGVSDINERIKRLDFAASVRKLHDFFAERLNFCLRDNNERIRIVNRYGSVLFPSPVLPGTEAIVPIQTMDELFNEGQIMNNCVASYADQLKQGGSTMYRVLQPERCTLYISRSICGKPEIEEIKTFCNGKPSSDTMKAVRDWIYLCEISEKQRILSELETVENEAGPVSSTAGSILVQQEW